GVRVPLGVRASDGAGRYRGRVRSLLITFVDGQRRAPIIHRQAVAELAVRVNRGTSAEQTYSREESVQSVLVCEVRSLTHVPDNIGRACRSTQRNASWAELGE